MRIISFHFTAIYLAGLMDEKFTATFFIWATEQENLSSGACNKVSLKPASSATETS